MHIGTSLFYVRTYLDFDKISKELFYMSSQKQVHHLSAVSINVSSAISTRTIYTLSLIWPMYFSAVPVTLKRTKNTHIHQ